MSLLRYLKPIDGLPDPRGSLSTTMSREAITAANQEIQKELNATKKRGQYKKYTIAWRGSRQESSDLPKKGQGRWGRCLRAARGIHLKCNPSLLVQNGGPVDLNKFWAHSLMKRMNFVQRKATTSKSKSSLVDFEEKKAEFLKAVAEAVVMEEIPAELVLNWDQTGIKLVPSSVWTMERQGEKRVEMVGINDKRQITAVFCGTMLGEFLPIQLIYQGKNRSLPPQVLFSP